MLEIPISDTEEAEVYKTIKEYLKKNHFFKLDEIIPFLKFNLPKSMNINKNKIQRIINSLIKKGLISPGSKLTWDDILKNKTRYEIFNYIEENPGVYLNEIMTSNNIGAHQALWHINILKKYLFIRSAHIENRKVYFKYKLDPKYDKFFYYLKNEKVQRILDLMEDNDEGLVPTIISNDLNMHYDTTRKYLEKLINLNLVSIEQENDGKKYKLDTDNYKLTLELLDHFK